MSGPLENGDVDTLQKILGQLTLVLGKIDGVEKNIGMLNEENIKRADEIKILARRGGHLLTEDEETSERGKSDTASDEEDNNERNFVEK